MQPNHVASEDIDLTAEADASNVPSSANVLAKATGDHGFGDLVQPR